MKPKFSFKSGVENWHNNCVIFRAGQIIFEFSNSHELPPVMLQTYQIVMANYFLQQNPRILGAFYDAITQYVAVSKKV